MFLKMRDFLFLWNAIKQAFQNSDNGDETLCVKIIHIWCTRFFPDLHSSSDSQICLSNGWSQHHLLFYRLNNTDKHLQSLQNIYFMLAYCRTVTIDIVFASSKKWRYVQSVVHFYTQLYWATANPENTHV